MCGLKTDKLQIVDNLVRDPAESTRCIFLCELDSKKCKERSISAEIAVVGLSVYFDKSIAIDVVFFFLCFVSGVVMDRSDCESGKVDHDR